MKAYAGVGSRETPIVFLELMESLATRLANEGVLLRSGGAKGADQAFEKGCDEVDGLKEIFRAGDCTNEAMELSSKYHPNWGACGSWTRKLHGRNAMIVLGANLDNPVDIVVCWTKDGKASGGTGQAIRIAEAYNIPIMNLNQGWEDDVIG